MGGGGQIRTLCRQNESNFAYFWLAHTSIFSLYFKPVCQIKLNCYILFNLFILLCILQWYQSIKIWIGASDFNYISLHLGLFSHNSHDCPLLTHLRKSPKSRESVGGEVNTKHSEKSTPELIVCGRDRSRSHLGRTQVPGDWSVVTNGQLSPLTSTKTLT